METTKIDLRLFIPILIFDLGIVIIIYCQYRRLGFKALYETREQWLTVLITILKFGSDFAIVILPCVSYSIERRRIQKLNMPQQLTCMRRKFVWPYY